MDQLNPPVKTAVVYHSGYGHTQRMAAAVADGAGAALVAIDADGNLADDAWNTLADADAILFGSPTYMGGPSWQFKKFADASSKVWFESGWQNKIFGGFTNSASINGDKLNTLEYFFLLAGQHGGIWVSMDIKPANLKASTRDDLNRMGAYIAPMAQTPADASPEEMSPGDLETARRYGARVAAIAGQLRAGHSRSN
ncbi:flavodoxin family protein [Burkholderia orbicola]|uniref:Flavoprotein WrbA n=3 Tax=Burkholderia cepacia complex TaxID=87882 RepID=A0A3R9B472_9BURK|nr:MULTISPECIES: flavodoxin family protein [Burkholderia cepacia complex]EKS9839992.1 flavodoxin family protein [Burkholderia cepacia]ABK12789.1 flavodoxin/nitric oxide synthase [Burkholderia cenocepacia HI2424]AQT55035.1 NADPH-dependent FMN reductase [Burkholderia cenocepacia]KOR18850.1 NADPH-dependent FMN reductase [Burkholderia cenocepacia]MBJ9669773.1 flavodoxin family protein [Burkholderia cenocepacia]